ncbi:MAG: hypothetical protein NTW33_10320, partial [Methanoregula sp.]|nr:hypothetical protein [Methanoregula sp.]
MIKHEKPVLRFDDSFDDFFSYSLCRYRRVSSRNNYRVHTSNNISTTIKGLYSVNILSNNVLP